MLWLNADLSVSNVTEILAHVRCSTRCMAYVAACAVFSMLFVQLACIYGL